MEEVMEEKTNRMPVFNQYIHMAEVIVTSAGFKFTFLPSTVSKLPRGNLSYLIELLQGLVEFHTQLYLLDDCKISLKYLRAWEKKNIFPLLRTNTDRLIGDSRKVSQSLHHLHIGDVHSRPLASPGILSDHSKSTAA